MRLHASCEDDTTWVSVVEGEASCGPERGGAIVTTGHGVTGKGCQEAVSDATSFLALITVHRTPPPPVPWLRTPPRHAEGADNRK